MPIMLLNLAASQAMNRRLVTDRTSMKSMMMMMMMMMTMVVRSISARWQEGGADGRVGRRRSGWASTGEGRPLVDPARLAVAGSDCLTPGLRCGVTRLAAPARPVQRRRLPGRPAVILPEQQGSGTWLSRPDCQRLTGECHGPVPDRLATVERKSIPSTNPGIRCLFCNIPLQYLRCFN